MTYRSESRGIMYTAPPSGDENAEDRRNAASETEDAPERETETRTQERDSPVLEPTTATTDANWTGTVPADD